MRNWNYPDVMKKNIQFLRFYSTYEELKQFL